MMLARIGMAVAVTLAACSEVPSPKEGPFGLRWGIDSNEAHRTMERQGYRLRGNYAELRRGRRFLHYDGPAYRGFGSDHDARLPKGGARYTLVLYDGKLGGAQVRLSFSDWTRCSTALAKLSAANDTDWRVHWEQWRPLEWVHYEERRPRRVWPIEESVSAEILYDSTLGPPYELMLRYAYVRDRDTVRALQ